MMKVSIVILNFNSKYFPRLCYEAIIRNKPDFKYEVIFVDNASNPEDESIKYLKNIAKEKKITLIESPENIGYGQGNNLGVAAAKGEYVIIMNPDIIIEEDSLKKMVEYMEQNPKVGVMGPKLTYADGTIQDSCRRNMSFLDLMIKRTPLKKIKRFKKRLNNYLMHDSDHTEVREVDLLCGACYIFPTQIYREVGGFDKRYFLFMEDFDICREINKRGYTVMYNPKINVIHNHKRLSDGKLYKLLLKKVFWIHVSSAIKYFLKWGLNK